MTDICTDRRTGRTPAENIYLRKTKNERDVAVLLLVDCSRSTATPVNGSTKTVLDLEKEAVVLFCEALEVIGDKYAVAGFSGFGRLGVEYCPIKDFGEALDGGVRSRIAGMDSLRRTRTGAAVRHAVARLEKIAAKVKILLLLGDGFPNDEGYRESYAVEDTKKAILEAVSKRIAIRSITVNISDVSGLNDVYGQFRNNVIADIRQLPGKLAGIYGTLI